MTAVATTVIDTMRQENLLAHIQDVGGYFLRRLNELAEQHATIVEVRGRGLMLGMELKSADHAATVVEAMLQRRIIINRTSETVLRFLPPYILERVHVDHAIQALQEVLSDLAVLPSIAVAADGDSFHE